MAVSFNLPDPYEAQKADIARRQKYAEALQQQAFQPAEQFSYQGIPAPIPATATLAKILAGVGGGLMQAQGAQEARELREGDIKKGQEFAAALQGAKTPEERQALAMRAMGGEFGQRAQIIGGGEYQMAETRAEAERKREARRQEVEDRLQAQRELAADRLASQQAIAGMAAGARADALRLQEELGRGRLEVARDEAARRAQQGDQPTVPAINAYSQAQMHENEAGGIARRMSQHAKDIEEGKLPLNYARVQGYRVQNTVGMSSPESQRFFSMMSDVNSSVDAVLRMSPGTKTEGDALRARQQILENPYDEENVKGALKKLAQAQSEVQDIYRGKLNQLGERFPGLQHERLPLLNPPAAAAGAPAAPQPPGAPAQRPAAPQAPGAAPGQQPAGAQASLPRPANRAEFDALPSGARFLDPNGQVRVKP